MDLTAFFDEFRAEAADHLRALDAQLLQLERDPADSEPIRQMFLSAHTIKGGAAMIGLDAVREVAHALEDVLGCLRDKRQSLDPTTADLLFKGVDVLRELVESMGSDAPADANAALVAALRRRAADGPIAYKAPGAEPRIQDRPAADAPEIQEPPAPSLPAVRPVPRVLLVEDSPTVRLLEEMLLSEGGFEVDAVEDGQEALARALAQSYQLVVAGIETPGLRGLELAAALRASPACRLLPILLTSSHDDAAQRRQAEEIGVQAILQKGSLSQHPLVAAAREVMAARPA